MEREKPNFDIPGRIDRERLARGWSEYTLAENSGLTQSTLSTWRRRNLQPNVTSIEKICHGLGITLEPGVKARRGQQGAFEGGNGVGDVVVGQRSLFTREGLLELGLVFRDRGNALDGKAFVWNGHFHRVHDRALGLFFGILGAAVPELGHVEAGVEHRGRVDRAFLPLVADGGLEVVRAAHAEVVARVARDKARFGQAWIEPELFAQLDLAGVGDFGGRNGRHRLAFFGLQRCARQQGGNAQSCQTQAGSGPAGGGEVAHGGFLDKSERAFFARTGPQELTWLNPQPL